ncbi:hypothetical protein PVK06_016808 [Gossypium arboreum]|uniref:Zinc knuckle CX2CX4HX4C domain-containing protein n=1 Tax=Gossypium arboreum TaxID=29729 RepID=A0ABR0Q1Q2_GOSAR|nr:hypothetical protein PVK06_016808 [Gossypium arboreum]
MEMIDGLFLVKFGLREDMERILNMASWSFDRCLFSMVPFVKRQDISHYCFLFVPFWVCIFNIPLEKMERQVAIDIGSAIGEVLAIDWRDREGCWVEYNRVRVKLNTSKPLRRVVYMVGAKGEEILCAIKYEQLPTFCYLCVCIGHHTHKCGMYERIKGVENPEFQYGNWLRV